MIFVSSETVHWFNHNLSIDHQSHPNPITHPNAGADIPTWLKDVSKENICVGVMCPPRANRPRQKSTTRRNPSDMNLSSGCERKLHITKAYKETRRYVLALVTECIRVYKQLSICFHYHSWESKGHEETSRWMVSSVSQIIVSVHAKTVKVIFEGNSIYILLPGS